MRRLLLAIFVLASWPLAGQAQQSLTGYRIDWSLVPAIFQNVDRIQRPCSSGSTPFASVIANPNGNTGNVAITTCTGGSVTINGATVTPGGGGVTCAGCTTNILTKYNGTNLADSRISDNGTDITANSGAGEFETGDVDFAFNGTYFAVRDSSGLVNIQANSNNANYSSIQATPGVVSLSATQGATVVGLGLSGVANWVVVEGGSFVPQLDGGTDLGTAGQRFKQLFLDATVTGAGTTGNQTINKSAGSVNFAAAATSLTVTSDKVTTSSIVICTVSTNDTTLKSVACVPAAGSFTMFANAAATAETKVSFWVLNQ